MLSGRMTSKALTKIDRMYSLTVAYASGWQPADWLYWVIEYPVVDRALMTAVLDAGKQQWHY